MYVCIQDIHKINKTCVYGEMDQKTMIRIQNKIGKEGSKEKLGRIQKTIEGSKIQGKSGV